MVLLQKHNKISVVYGIANLSMYVTSKICRNICYLDG